MNPQLLSFAAIVQQYHPVLVRYARLIVHQHAGAEAIASLALMAYWDNREHVQTPGELRTFFMTTIPALCEAWLKREHDKC